MGENEKLSLHIFRSFLKKRKNNYLLKITDRCLRINLTEFNNGRCFIKDKQTAPQWRVSTFLAGQRPSECGSASTDFFSDWASSCRPDQSDESREATDRTSRIHSVGEGVLLVRRRFKQLRRIRIGGRARMLVGSALRDAGETISKCYNLVR
jgi:hypothetical protein